MNGYAIVRSRPVMLMRALVLMLLAVVPALSRAQISPWVSNPSTGNLYAITTGQYWGVDKCRVINTPTVLDAEALAMSLGAHLVTVNDAAENAWIIATFGHPNNGNPSNLDENLWIGFHDLNVEGTFEWFSGEPVTYTNWASTEPANDQCEDVTAIDHPSVGALGEWNDLGARMLGEPGPHFAVFEMPGAVPVAPATWGRIKNLY